MASFEFSVLVLSRETLRRAYALTGAPAGTTLALGLNRNAKTSSTTNAPTDGTSQIDFQSCTVRQVVAAFATHVGSGIVYLSTTAPDTNAPMK